MVLGIDLGSNSSVIATIQRNAVQVVRNDVSERLTPSLVSFTDKERLYGDQSLAQVKSNLKNTCRYMKSLLGRTMPHPNIRREETFSLSQLSEAGDGTIGYKVNYQGNEEVMSVVRVMAVLLSKLKGIAVASTGGTSTAVEDCVLGVPGFYNDLQRLALIQACQMAGLGCLRIMNEHTATALDYGIYRAKTFSATEATNVVFINLGHCNFSVSISRFTSGKLEVLSAEHDECLGGRDFDYRLVHHFAKVFEKTHKVSPLTNNKARLKLEEAASNCKKVLSANTEAQVSIECLIEEYDLGVTVTRKEFECMCEDFTPRLVCVMERVLVNSNLTKEQIHFVELVGGSVRIPWVQQVLSSYFGREPSKTLQMDECVARGCALQAAMLSPFFNVREFTVADHCQDELLMSWTTHDTHTHTHTHKQDDTDVAMADADSKKGQSVVFASRTPYNLLKSITFNKSQSFSLRVWRQMKDGLCRLDLGQYTIDVPHDDSGKMKKIKVRVRLNIHGVFTIDSAQILEDLEVTEMVMEKKKVPKKKNIQEDIQMSSPTGGVCGVDEQNTSTPVGGGGATTTSPHVKSPTRTHTQSNDNTNDIPNAEGENTTTSGGGGDTNTNQQGGGINQNNTPTTPVAGVEEFEEISVKVPQKRIKTKRTDLHITTPNLIGILPQNMFEIYSKREVEMFKEDLNQQLTRDKLNEFEASIYSLRNSIQGNLKEYIIPSNVSYLERVVEENETWLFDSYDADTNTLQKKLDSLREKFTDAIWRQQEHSTRQPMCEEAQATITNCRALLQSPSPDLSHIADEKKQNALRECQALEHWLNDSCARQGLRPLHEQPLFTTGEVRDKTFTLKQLCDTVMGEKKPAPTPTKVDESKPDVDAQTHTQTHTQTGDVDMCDTHNETHTQADTQDVPIESN
eukprot:GHVR01164815.1.p1 GENE.GHVR01164815.1~~GHVR01164815.1.p1  ORF type:complete len:910 (+),score=295.71 GHVR01164815.1:70-2799(+)